VILGFVFCAVTYLQAVTGVVPLPARRDPTANAYGWSDVAAAVARETGASRRWVAANRYQDAAQLAFNLPDHPTVFSLNLARRTNQYLMWPGFPESAKPGDDLLLVLFEQPEGASDPVLEHLTPYFRSVEQGELVVMRRGASPVGSRRLWRLSGWMGEWPSPLH
jgi:hypothetical protein